MKATKCAAALGVTIIFLFGGREASALYLDVAKDVYRYGDVIEVRYVINESEARYDFVHVLHLVRAGEGSEKRFRQLREDAGTLEVDSRDISDPSSGGGPDSTRQLFAFMIRATDPATKQVFEAVDYFWILHPKEAEKGALVPARERIVPGQTLDVEIRDFARLLAENSVKTTSYLDFLAVRLGNMLPGGAALADHVISLGPDDAKMSLGRDAGIKTFTNLPVGHYELRLLGATGAVLDRAPFTIAPPVLTDAIRLEPPADGPYLYSNPPEIFLDIDKTLLDEDVVRDARLSRIQLLDEDVVSNFSNGRSGRGIRDMVERSESTGQSSFWAQGAYPGTYEIWLTTKLNHYREFVVDKAALELGGAYAYPDFLPKPQEPILDRDEVGLILSPGNRLPAGSEITASVALPAGFDAAARGLFVSLRRRITHGFDCLTVISNRHEVVDHREMPLDADGKITFRAPPIPERWEIVLWEPTDQSTPRYLGHAEFDTEIAPVPGALRWRAPPTLGEPLQIAYAVPDGLPFEKYTVEIVRSAETVPGAPLPERQKRFEGKLPRSGGVTFDALWAGGPYEVRLIVDGRNYVLDRLPFDLVDRRAPDLPADYAYSRAPADAVPTDEEDPIRGLAVWWPAFDDCEEPSFPTPPEITVVERMAPADPATDSEIYRPVTTPFPGHPYHLEVRFASAPPEERYRVHVDDRLRVKIWRTADPRLYRSEVVVFQADVGR